MLNTIYKDGNNTETEQYVVFSKWYSGLEGYNTNRVNEESLELRKLKLIVTGFHKSLNNNLMNDKLKQFLKVFISNMKLVNKIIVNKLNVDKNKIALKTDYENIFFESDEDLIKKLHKIRKRRFEIFIANRNKKNDNFISLLKHFYKRLFNFFDFENNIIVYYNENNSKKVFNDIKVRMILYSVQVFDKMIKLITKIVLLNSKFFFLNNIKYNYTLLKFCDKTMKLINSILLFCLLCDINIPYYCFHSDLSIAGNCRMCLVQLDTSLKPIASCAVGITINSTIYTNTKIIQKAREGVLEFLLINHPLDCPICDQGGECDLQEQFITYGNDRGRFLKKMI